MARKPKTTASDEPETPAVDETPAVEPEAAPPPTGSSRQAERNLVEAKKVDLPKRNLGGMYRCKCRVAYGDKVHPPGTELKMSDAEARHFLAVDALEPLD